MNISTPQALKDYRLAFLSRQLSVQARKEVASGKASFGIFGEGKEVAQIALSKQFHLGDWRSGYYRDQTFVLALGALTAEQFFSQLYADAQISTHPHSGGRQMNSHFASRYYANGTWHRQSESSNIAADMSCTSGQLPRLIGLGLASQLYRHSYCDTGDHSKGGSEVAFGTIGDASTSEGHFWETLNTMGVLQIPVAISVWDDGYGISVPRHVQTTKGSLAEVLPGFAGTSEKKGVEYYHVRGWDYPALLDTYEKAIRACRRDHQPCVIHVDELTQPLGHSTSGTAARYKSSERLQWEKDYDALICLRRWLLENSHSTDHQLTSLESEVIEEVREARDQAFQKWQQPLKEKNDVIFQLLSELAPSLDSLPPSPVQEGLFAQLEYLMSGSVTRGGGEGGPPHRAQRTSDEPDSYHLHRSGTIPGPSMAYTHLTSHQFTTHLHKGHDLIRRLAPWLRELNGEIPSQLLSLADQCQNMAHTRYHSHISAPSHRSPLRITSVPPVYNESQKGDHASGESSPQLNDLVDGRIVIRDYFNIKLAQIPELIIMGEDVARLGGVNSEFEGLLETHGAHRIMDTGIREATILGQGHGLAMRGFRPIIDIQYLDYLIFCLQGMSDDLASLHYRSAGGQITPSIIRTKGHRLMGIWHSGSPMGMLLNALRGMHIAVPRNMVQACGIYQTLLSGDDPGLVIEPMNGYRIKERRPANLGEYTVALGSVETMTSGSDITVVTYGSCSAVALEAVSNLSAMGVHIELLSCPTLLPFDTEHHIGRSLQNTQALVVMDEDVPGGASAFMLRHILEEQGGYRYLDAAPKTLTAKEHRPPYSTDGDYYTKPQAIDLIEVCLSIIAERSPQRYNKTILQASAP